MERKMVSRMPETCAVCLVVNKSVTNKSSGLYEQHITCDARNWSAGTQEIMSC